MMFAQRFGRYCSEQLLTFRFSSLILLSLFMFTACNPPPVVDQPASDLDVKIAVLDVDESPSDGKVIVAVQFFSNGKYVELGDNVTVKCNDVLMPWNGLLGYAGRVPMVQAGGTYVCVHERNGQTSTITVLAPARPVFVSPVEGATVSRSSSLTITYTSGSGTGVRGGASDSATSFSANVQPDNGTYTLDASSMHAGPGTISLTRELTFTPAGSGFHSVEVSYSSGSEIAITWS